MNRVIDIYKGLITCISMELKRDFFRRGDIV